MCITRFTAAVARLLMWAAVTSFDSSPTLTAWRALLAVAVVFVMLATTGWTAVRHQRSDEPRDIALTSWARGRIAGHPLPDVDASPYRLAQFFASLTAAQRTALADKYPLVVGNLNGAPITLRYHANRRALVQARAVEQQRMHDVRLSPTAAATRSAGWSASGRCLPTAGTSWPSTRPGRATPPRCSATSTRPSGSRWSCPVSTPAC